MKAFKINIILLIISVISLISGCDTQEQKTEDLGRFNKLSWIENIWRGKQGEAKLYESWHKKNFRLMEGISYTTDENGRRVYSQDMRIEQNNNQVFYIIKLTDDQQQTLKLIEVTDTSAVFENQDEGYPQKITYRHPSDNYMIVSLEGENEGTSMNTKLSYEKD